MKLYCRLVPKDEATRDSMVARLNALNSPPIIHEGSIIVNYEGPCSGHALAIITVFESFGCDHVIMFKDLGGEDGQQSLKVVLGGAEQETDDTGQPPLIVA